MAKKAGAGLHIVEGQTVVDQAIVGAFESLPEKKQVFIRELHKNGWNKTQAGLKAGCKSSEGALATANNWLKERTVQFAIEEFQAKDNKAATLDVDDLKAELWKNHLRADRVSDSNKALELILRLLGAFKDSLDVNQQVSLATVLADLSSKAKEENRSLSDKEVIAEFETKEDLPDKGESTPDKSESSTKEE
jgi:hypothetical protein